MELGSRFGCVDISDLKPGSEFLNVLLDKPGMFIISSVPVDTVLTVRSLDHNKKSFEGKWKLTVEFWVGADGNTTTETISFPGPTKVLEVLPLPDVGSKEVIRVLTPKNVEPHTAKEIEAINHWLMAANEALEISRGVGSTVAYVGRFTQSKRIETAVLNRLYTAGWDARFQPENTDYSASIVIKGPLPVTRGSGDIK